MKNDIRMTAKQWSANMWSRIQAIFTPLDARVTALEQGGGGGGEENVIESISFNGSNVPPVNKNVALSESDPTVPAWAKAPTKPTYTASEVGALPSSTTYVSGVKGDAESSYRAGNVNLTPGNLGAQVDVGLYIDSSGYICQRIRSDT